jgi:hypothetical protein
VTLDNFVAALVAARVFCNLPRLFRSTPSPFRGTDMLRRAGHLLLVLSALVLPLAAHAAPSLSISLKNYYTDYEIVLECSGKAHLTPADAEAAKNAIAKVEAHYLKRDPSIDKEQLLKQAVINKNAAFKMVKAQNQVEAVRFCKASLNDLVGKLREIDGASLAREGGS